LQRYCELGWGRRLRKSDGMVLSRRDVTLAMAALPAGRWHGGVMIEMSATAAVEAMRRGEIGAEAYAQALLARCEAGKGLNAFIALDPDKVLAAARAADVLRR
jgi:hypothetical protein